MSKLIGTDPNQVPSNADLGDLAYQDASNVVVDNLKIGNINLGTTPSAWLTVIKDNDNSGNQVVIADGEGATAAIRTYSIPGSSGDPAGLILNHYYAQTGSGNQYMRYADFVANVGNGAGTTMRFITKNSSNAYSTGLQINQDGDVKVGALQIDGVTVLRADRGIERTARHYIDLSHTVGTTGSTEGFNQLYHSAYKVANGLPGTVHANGNWYVALSGTGGDMYAHYALSVNSAKSLRVLGTFANFADSVNRTATLQYSVDQGNTWIAGNQATIGSTSGSSVEFTINLTQHSDHLGTILVRFIWSNANSNLVGINRVFFEAIDSSSGPSLIPNYVEPNQFKIVNTSHSGDRPRYSYRAGHVMASNFNNPTQNILTVNSAQANHHLSVYVRMRQSVYTTNGGSNLQHGLAEYVSGGTNSVDATNMTELLQTGGAVSVGSLSWSGNTLQVTGIRGSNYDRYYLTVEVIEANNVSWTWNI
jgi:hypothetical protein